MTNKSLKMIAGYRSLADMLDEKAEDLTGPQVEGLTELLRQAWEVVERRQGERRRG